MGKSNKTPPNGQPRQKRRKALRQNRFRVCGLGMRNTGKTPFFVQSAQQGQNGRKERWPFCRFLSNGYYDIIAAERTVITSMYGGYYRSCPQAGNYAGTMPNAAERTVLITSLYGGYTVVARKQATTQVRCLMPRRLRQGVGLRRRRLHSRI